jgi:hypothetical protein
MSISHNSCRSNVTCGGLPVRPEEKRVAELLQGLCAFIDWRRKFNDMDRFEMRKKLIDITDRLRITPAKRLH